MEGVIEGRDVPTARRRIESWYFIRRNEDENLEIFQQKVPKTYKDDLKTWQNDVTNSLNFYVSSREGKWSCLVITVRNPRRGWNMFRRKVFS